MRPAAKVGYGPAPVRSSWLAVLIALATLLLLVVAQHWPGLSHDLSPPISWDHGSHLGKAMLTARMLPSVRGWTDLVETGLPLNTMYTPSGPLWILLFRAFTPFLAWHQTYALAIVGFRFMVALTTFRLARVAGAGVVGATLAGVLTLADVGDHSEGGWFYDVLYGVWPMSLAMCFFFLAYADLLEVVTYRGEPLRLRRLMARAMVLLGIALFSHQMSLVAFGLLLPVLIAVRATARRPGEDASLRQDLSRVLPVAVVAALVAAWWMVPMLTMSRWLEDHGQLYVGTDDMGARMVAGEGILRGGVWTGVLAAIGLGTSVFAKPTRRVLAIGALVAMLVGSAGWFVWLDVPRYLPAFGRIMYPRLMMVAKPLIFACVGCALSDLVAGMAPAVRSQLRTPQGKLGALIAVALLVPFLPSVPDRLMDLIVRRDVTTTASLGTWNDWQAVWAHVDALPGGRSPETNDFYRVAYFSDSTHLPQAAPAYSHRPGHITGPLVGESFRNKTDSTHPDALRAINVRYVVTEGPATGELAGELTQLETFGALRLYELEGWHGDVASAPLGEASPVIESYGDDHVVLRPEGARVVVVRRAMGPGWTAEADGVEIPIGEERVYDSPALRLIRLELPAGVERVELRYHGFGSLYLIGWLFTLIGLAAALAVAGGWERIPVARRQLVIDRVRALGVRARTRVSPRVVEGAVRFWPALVCIAPFAAVALLAARGARGTHLPIVPHEAAIVAASGATESCGGAARSHVCGGNEIGVSHLAVDGVFHSCLTARPPRSGALVLTWDDLPMSGTLHLGAGIDDQAFLRTGEPVELTVSIDGGPPEVMRVPVSHEWITADVPVPAGDVHDVRIEVRSRATDRRWLCLDAVAR